MKAAIIWHHGIEHTLAELSPRESEEIFGKIDHLQHYPRMYRIAGKGRFRRHRRFRVGNWFIYYRVVENEVHIRGIWPARMRQPRP